MTNTEPGFSSRATDRVVWFGLLILLILVPLPFGSNRPWAWSLLGLWSSLLLAGWGLAIAFGRRVVFHKVLLFPLIVFALELIWILSSLIPGIGSPHSAWDLASQQLAEAGAPTLTLSSGATLAALARLLAYVSIFWLSVQYCRNRDRAEQMLAVIAWSGLAYGAYGLINLFAGNEYLLWYSRWTGTADVTGTFVNRNHYATFAGLGLLAAIALGISSFRSAWQLSDRSQGDLPRTIECLAGRPAMYMGMALVISMAWLQAHSRMGAAAVLLGLLVMLLLLVATKLVRSRWVPITTVLALVLLFQVSGGITLERLQSTNEIDRLPTFSIVIDQIATAPWTGSGYGTFEKSFQIYRDERLLSATVFGEAHNTYLELASEIGIPATVLLILAILWLAGFCVVGAFRRQRAQIFPIVSASATMVVGAHAVFDFSLQIPAIAAIYAAILGAGVAQSWSTDA